MVDWILLLAVVTFLLVLAFVTWTKMSAARHSRTGEASGPGSSSDPMAGSTDAVRPPDALRQSLDSAANAPAAR